MAKGYNKHAARKEALGKLGRALARRARSACELCEARNTRLDPVEIEPLPEEPELERSAMLCERCQKAVAGGALDAQQWRFLESAVWNELPVVQVVAVRILDRLVADDVGWAVDLRDSLYLSEEVSQWLG